MRIKNIHTNPVEIAEIKRLLQPNEEITLYDEDAERYESLLRLLDLGLVVKVSDEEPLEVKYARDIDVSEAVPDVVLWIRLRETYVSFISTIVGKHLLNVSLNAGQPTTLFVGVTDPDGILSLFDNETIITLQPSAGITVDPTSVSVSKGKASVVVTATQSGTIQVTNNRGLQNINLGVTVI